LQAANALFSQEIELRLANGELTTLRAKQSELAQMEAELAAVNIPVLKEEVETLAKSIDPQSASLQELRQKQAELKVKVSELNRQQETISAEIESHQSRHKSISVKLCSDINQLIHFTANERSQLDINLQDSIATLESERKAYQQQWDLLQRTIQASNLYQSEVETIRDDLSNHYRADQQLSEHLPHDRSKFTAITNTIRDRLLELDQELDNTRKCLEKSSKKTIITFSQ